MDPNHFSVGLKLLRNTRVLDEVRMEKGSQDTYCYTTTHKALESDYFFEFGVAPIVLFFDCIIYCVCWRSVADASCTFTRATHGAAGSGVSSSILRNSILL
jgi:hypothetical protein